MGNAFANIVVALRQTHWFIFLLVEVLFFALELFSEFLKLDLLLLNFKLQVFVVHIPLLVVLSTLHEINRDLSDFFNSLVDDRV